MAGGTPEDAEQRALVALWRVDMISYLPGNDVLTVDCFLGCELHLCVEGEIYEPLSNWTLVQAEPAGDESVLGNVYGLYLMDDAIDAPLRDYPYALHAVKMAMRHSPDPHINYEGGL